MKNSWGKHHKTIQVTPTIFLIWLIMRLLGKNSNNIYKSQLSYFLFISQFDSLFWMPTQTSDLLLWGFSQHSIMDYIVNYSAKNYQIENEIVLFISYPQQVMSFQALCSWWTSLWISTLHSSNKESFKKTESKSSSDISTVKNKERAQNNSKILSDARPISKYLCKKFDYCSFCRGFLFRRHYTRTIYSWCIRAQQLFPIDYSV